MLGGFTYYDSDDIMFSADTGPYSTKLPQIDKPIIYDTEVEVEGFPIVGCGILFPYKIERPGLQADGFIGIGATFSPQLGIRNISVVGANVQDNIISFDILTE